MIRGHVRAEHPSTLTCRAIDVIEAKPEGLPLSGVEWPSAMCTPTSYRPRSD